MVEMSAPIFQEKVMLWLAKLVGPKLAPFVMYGVIVLAVLAALWWLRHDAYRDGERAADAKWEAASAALQKRVIKSSSEATIKSDARVIEQMKRVEEVKEKLDEADRTGASSLDVLFGVRD